MKIQNIDKATAVMLGDEIMEAVNKIAEKYGLQAKRGGGRYGDSEYKLNNVTLFVSGSDGDSGNSRYTPTQLRSFKVNFDMRKGMNGMSEVNVGDTYFDRSKGADMVVVGWDTKKRKYPCLVECVADGSSYKMTPNSLRLKFS